MHAFGDSISRKLFANNTLPVGQQEAQAPKILNLGPCIAQRI